MSPSDVPCSDQIHIPTREGGREGGREGDEGGRKGGREGERREGGRAGDLVSRGLQMRILLF